MKNTVLLRVSGKWAHFKKPETNNNPLTHDFLTKTALVGMMGAVLGKDREQMRPLSPQLCEDVRYGVALENPVKKQSWSFTLRRFATEVKNQLEVTTLSPRPFEFLREPCFLVAVTLIGERSREPFLEFVRLISESRTHFDPVLGLHNCPAELKIIVQGEAVLTTGPFQTFGFLPRHLKPRPPSVAPFRVGFDRIPTYQNSEMWNPPDRYVEVVYLDASHKASASMLAGEGEHYCLHLDNGEVQAWSLI